MKNLLRWIKSAVDVVSGVFDDWLTRLAGLLFVAIVAVVIFNMNFDVADAHPLLGTLIFLMGPGLFIVGGIIFVLAILRFSRQGDNQGENNGKPEQTP